MATDLGKAYIQIMPSAKGISGSIQKTIEPEAAAAGRSAGRSIASTMSDSLSSMGDTLTSAITKPVGLAATAVSGLVGALGFRRLVGLDSAQAKLRGLGYEAEEVERISGQVTDAIQDGMTTMAEGVDIAAGALAAGVDEGDDLQRYIKLVGDAAVGAQRPVADMAMIFNRVQGSGRLMTQELNMIEQGMPGFSQAMADHLTDGSMEAFRDMVSAGEVGSEEFLEVMDDFAGGMAEAYSESWAGMAKNTLAYVGIIGESLLEGVFEDGKAGLASLIELLKSDEVLDWATRTGESLKEMLDAIVDGIREAKSWWDDLSPTVQELIKDIALFGSIGLVSLGPILKILGRLTGLFTFIKPLITGLGTALAALASPIGITVALVGALAGAFIYFFNTNEEFRENVLNLWESFKDTMIEVWETIFDYVTPIFEEIKDFVMEIWGTLIEWWDESHEQLMEAVENVWGFIWGIIEGYLNMVWEFIQFLWPVIEDVFINAWETIKGIIRGALDVILGIVDVFISVFTGDWEGAWEAIKDIVSGLLDIIGSIIKGALNGIKITVTTIFNAIKGIASRVWNAIKDTISSIVNSVKDTVSNIFNSFRDVVNRAFNRVRDAVRNGINRALDIVTNIGSRFKEAGRNIVTSIADGIKGAISKVTDAIGNVTSKIRDFLPFSPPKTGPLIDIMDVDWGGTIGGGIEDGEDEITRAMESALNVDLPQHASISTKNKSEHNSTENEQRPIVLQVDGKTFAQIMGDYTSEEGGNRIRKIERGLA